MVKRTKLPADIGDKDDSDKPEPQWDSSLRNLRLYLIPLKRWLPRQHPQLNNFVGGSTAGWLAIVHFGSVRRLCGLFERSKSHLGGSTTGWLE